MAGEDIEGMEQIAIPTSSRSVRTLGWDVVVVVIVIWISALLQLSIDTPTPRQGRIYGDNFYGVAIWRFGMMSVLRTRYLETIKGFAVSALKCIYFLSWWKT